MRLVYFGSSPFGLPTLKHLLSAHEVVAAVTQPDRPAGRGGRLEPTPVGAFLTAEQSHIPLLKPERIRDAVDAVRSLRADAWVVIAYGQKLPRALLEGRFAINLHASLLPRWRGAAPVHAAVLAGDTITGNSVITLADRMDAGEILAASRRDIAPAQTSGELHDLLAADGPPLIERVLSEFAAAALRPITQDESLVTIAPKLSSRDGWVDFTAPARDCRCRINGLSPAPGITVRFADQPLKLLRAVEHPGDTNDAPGTLVDPRAGLIACGGGTLLRLIDVQPPGKRPMEWSAFANGRRPQAGQMMVGRCAMSLTLWDLIEPAPPKRAPDKPNPAKPPRPARAGRPQRPGAPAAARRSAPLQAVPRRHAPMAARYEEVTRAMLARYGVRVRKWRSSMSGVAWQLRYADGTVTRLIESPRPRGPMSAAIFLHEIGHHAIGLGAFKPRCLEEYHAWAFAITQMEALGLTVTDGVRRRMAESLWYAVDKARRRGLRDLPPELDPFTTRPERRRRA